MSAVTRNHPLAHELPLPLKARYHPLGIPVDIVTNSEDIFAAADPAWSRYPEVPGADRVTLRVMVEGSGAIASAPPSMTLGQGSLISIAHGPDNFAVCDLSTSFAFARFTQDVAADSAWVRYYFLDPAVYMMIEARHFCPVHASCISLNGRAILLCGDSGSGKTSLAYACAKQGWTYLATAMRPTSFAAGRGPTVAGRPFSIRFRAEARTLFPELGVYMPERRPNGKLDLEVDTAELGLTIALESKACCIVFLNRQKASQNAAINPFPRGEAFRQSSGVICYGDRHIRSAQTQALHGFLELPVMELTYSEFGRAEKALRELAEGAV